MRFGAIFLYAVPAYTPILRKRACSVLHVVVFFSMFLRIFHAVHCAVGSGLPLADSLDFTMCLGDRFFVSSLKVSHFMRLE